MTIRAAPPVSPLLNFVIFFFLAAFSTLIRFPWFFKDVIDGDESVFILVGQALADGHLPYVKVWDNKPPLGFVFFSAVLTIFPDSLAFVRLSGAVLVAVSALLVFWISLKLMPMLHSLVSAILTVIAISILFRSGQCVMMEHVALVPLLGALLLSICDRPSSWTYFTIGSLLGVATLTRLNLAYVAIAVPTATILLSDAPKLKDRFIGSLWISMGGLFVLCATYLPYGLTGNSKLFFDSTFKVPLAYTSGLHSMGYADTARAMITHAVPRLELDLFTSPNNILSLMLWILGGIGLLSVALLNWPRGEACAGRWLAVFAAATLFSILSSAHRYTHYLIQVAPLFAIGLGCVLSLLRGQSRYALALVIGLVLLSVTQLWPGYMSLAERRLAGAELYHGQTFELAAHLKNIANPGDTILLGGDILVYWLMKKYPVVPVAAFPANILDENGILKPLYGPAATKEAVLERLFLVAPTRIVLSPYMNALSSVQFFRDALARDYDLESETLDRQIFRRREITSSHGQR